MIELLIFAKNTPLTGIAKVDKARYKRGDMVTVQKGGWRWTAQESKAVWIREGMAASDWPGTFFLIKITDINSNRVARFRSLGEPDQTIAFLPGPKDLVAIDTLHARRLRFLDVGALPLFLKRKLRRDAEITVTKAQIRNFIKRKSDGAPFDPGLD